jgi:tetratricopeptide (TPR) repeat protein
VHTGYYSITRIDAGDDTGYYAYLRSAFFDGDIDFFNEKGYYHFYTITETGYSINYWSIGSAILWIPFFLIGHAIASIYSFLGYHVSVDGYSFPYHTLTGIGSGLCVFLGLLLSFSLLKNYFSEKASLLATMTLFLATPLPYFTFIRQRMSHAGEFLVVVFFIYSWILYRNKCRNVMGSILFGISAGMLCIIRLNTGIFLLIPVIDFLIQVLRGFYEKKDGEVKLLIRNILIMSIAAIIVVLPQLVVWDTIMGKPLPPTGHVSFALSNLMEGLRYVFMGRDWGVFITQPVWIFGLIGLGLFMKREKGIGVLFFLSVLASLIICAGFLNEASFGHRFILNCNVFLAFGVAALIDAVSMKRKVIVVTAISFLLIMWNYFLIIQYKVLMEYNDPLFALKAFENIPTILFNNQSHLLRSTSFFKLILLENARLSSYSDWFFLALLPLLALCLSVLLLSIFLWLQRPRLKKSLLSIVALGTAFFIFVNGIAFAMHKKKTDEGTSLRYKQLAYSSLVRGVPDSALHYLEKARDLRDKVNAADQAEDGAINKHLCAALNTQAVKYYKDNKLQEALSMFAIALEIYPGSDTVHKNVGVIYYEVKNYEKALFHLKRSLELNAQQEQVEVMRRIIKELQIGVRQ